MSIFNFDTLLHVDINKGMEEYENTPGAILLDVRTEEEYEDEHIKGSINVPLHIIYEVAKKIRNINAPIFVYCRSGARSRKAVNIMKQMGYTNVKNIGGITDYIGETEVK